MGTGRQFPVIIVPQGPLPIQLQEQGPGGQVDRYLARPNPSNCTLQVPTQAGNGVVAGPLVVGAAVVVVPLQLHVCRPSQHHVPGPLVVVGQAGVVADAPPGTQPVRTHSPETDGQYSGGSHPQGGVVVGCGVVTGPRVVVVAVVAPNGLSPSVGL